MTRDPRRGAAEKPEVDLRRLVENKAGRGKSLANVVPQVYAGKPVDSFGSSRRKHGSVFFLPAPKEVVAKVTVNEVPPEL
jgi:hypothetical protein